MNHRAIAVAVPLFVALPAAAGTETIVLSPTADALIYLDGFGDTGNGSGEYFHIGKTISSELRRSLLRFDIAGSIPAGATIESASLRLYCSRTLAASFPASLHALAADWGEGPSNPTGNEGAPAAAAPGDVTWVFRFYEPGFSGPRWTNLGGDFAPTPSATTSVGGEGQFYTWSSAQMAADCQAWLDAPSGDFGWILLGAEGVAGRTSKRFDSRTNPSTATRPTLTIEYTIGNDCAADLAAPFGVLDLADIQFFVAAFLGQDAAADIAPPTGVWDLADLQAFVAAFNAGCP